MSKDRLEKNLEILDKLFYYLKENPTIRFGQALSNLNLATHRGYLNVDGQGEKEYLYEDIFFEEPETTLKQIKT